MSTYSYVLNLNIIEHVWYIVGAGKGLVGCYSLHGPESYFNALTTCSSAEGYVVNVDSWMEDTALAGKSCHRITIIDNLMNKKHMISLSRYLMSNDNLVWLKALLIIVRRSQPLKYIFWWQRSWILLPIIRKCSYMVPTHNQHNTRDNRDTIQI